MKTSIVIVAALIALFASQVSATKISKKPDFVGTIGELIEVVVKSDENSSIKSVGKEAARLIVTLAKQIWDYVCKEPTFKKTTVGELCDKPTVGTALTIAYKIAKFMHTLHIPSRVMNYIGKHLSKPEVVPESSKTIFGNDKGPIMGYFFPEIPEVEVAKGKSIFAKKIKSKF